MTSILAGRRIMVVEDELLVAMLIEDILTDLGSVVLGPFTNVQDAVVAAGSISVDAALLDVNLRGEKVYPVADLLSERGIPFLLLSGYGSEAVPDGRDWRAISKPFTASGLVAALSERVGTIALHEPG